MTKQYLLAAALAGVMATSSAQAGLWDDFVDWVEDAAEDTGDWFEGAADDVAGWVTGAADDIDDFFSDAGNSMEDFFSNVGNSLGTAVNYVENGAETVVTIVESAYTSAITNYDYKIDRSEWKYTALTLQNRLDHDQPMSNTLFFGTHNSYNATEYSDGLSYIDPNHDVSLYDQLQAGARALELDPHWYYITDTFWLWDGEKDASLCHGQDSHIGCSSYDRSLLEGLVEINIWLRENSNDVIAIYYEDHLDNHHDAAIAYMQDTFGDLVYKPDATNGCDNIDADLTKQQILNSGKQVLLISRDSVCDKGADWQSWVFAGVGTDDDGWDVKKVANARAGDCGTLSGGWRRYFEDRTDMAEIWKDVGYDERINAEDMAAIFACEPNFIGLDMFATGDTDRITGAIWSWNNNEPNNSGDEDCGKLRSDGRWNDAKCANTDQYACRDDEGNWVISSASGEWDGGFDACTSLGGSYAYRVPVNYNENQALMSEANGNTLWMNYHDASEEGYWEANQPAGKGVVSFTLNSVDESADATGQDDYCGGNSAGNIVLADVSSYSGTDPSVLRMYQSSGKCYVKIQEDSSNDSETGHANETVDVIAFTSDFNLGETGVVTTGDDWVTVNLNNSYANPVVVAFGATMNGSDPVTTEIKNVTSNSFQVQVEEFEWDDGNHTNAEDIHYVVIEAGTYAIADGYTLVAGTVDLDTKLDGSLTEDTVIVGLDSYALVTAVQQNDSSYVLDTEVQRASNSFTVGLMPEESKDNNGATISGTVSYIAVGN